MKNLLYLVAIFFIGGAASAKTLDNNAYPYGNGNAYIFTEEDVEFAVYPNGAFDFRYLGSRNHTSIRIETANTAFTYNSGYDYEAYVQHDDFGAVIQVEDVPIYYDYYGRIIRAGDVIIHYNDWGGISRVGGMYIHYNRYNRFSHFTGYINFYNRHYVYQPWHQYYVLPHPHVSVVYHYPYRAYYHPFRYDYGYYRNNIYNIYKRENRNFNKPSDKKVAYNRGRRTEQPRNLRTVINRERSENDRVTENRNLRTEVANSRRSGDELRTETRSRRIDDNDQVRSNTRTVRRAETPKTSTKVKVEERRNRNIFSRTATRSDNSRAVRSTPNFESNNHAYSTSNSGRNRSTAPEFSRSTSRSTNISRSPRRNTSSGMKSISSRSEISRGRR